METNSETLYSKLLKDYNKELNHTGISGERLATRLYKLSQVGKTKENGVTRIGYSPKEMEAKELVMSWMKDAGLAVTTDGAGNVFGRMEGKSSAAAILSGSHVDSVPNGGNFDGPLGVLAALEVAEAWKETGYVPPVPYEVVIFTDEEGSRFKTGLTGSRAFMGKHTQEGLDNFIDEEGNSFDEVIAQYGSSRENYLNPNDKSKDIAMFVEVHIEQGKVLEKKNQPIGIVNGIAGPTWLEVQFTGEAAHAGNTAMEMRKDPVIAMGMFVQEIESLPRKVSETAVATVGKIDVLPNGVNVIAQEVNMMVDIRDIKKAPRDKLVQLICDAAENIAIERGIKVKWQINSNVDPLPIDDKMQEDLAEVYRALDVDPVYIPSGAGHDTMILGEKYPAAMLFVRSKDGISHRPDEWTSLNDCVIAVHALKRYIEKKM